MEAVTKIRNKRGIKVRTNNIDIVYRTYGGSLGIKKLNYNQEFFICSNNKVRAFDDSEKPMDYWFKKNPVCVYTGSNVFLKSGMRVHLNIQLMTAKEINDICRYKDGNYEIGLFDLISLIVCSSDGEITHDQDWILFKNERFGLKVEMLKMYISGKCSDDREKLKYEMHVELE